MDIIKRMERMIKMIESLLNLTDWVLLLSFSFFIVRSALKITNLNSDRGFASPLYIDYIFFPKSSLKKLLESKMSVFLNGWLILNSISKSAI
jgi:hypothetical protein